ncbi:MAG: hypothetical protein C7B44_01485 [Sulfobacillus thermosulfidooxidans]|nr:MAG: hypothetical protein C7B44_01485 [Sulfobacillus thermosulfidooxidans]
MPKFVTSEGAICYTVHGSGPAVVFLHSALTDHRQWNIQVNRLSNDYCCITYDLWADGLTDQSPQRYDPADTLVALLNYLEVETATLVGSSLGGAVAIHAGKRYPARVSSLVLLGTGLFGFQPKIDGPDPAIYAEYEAALAAHDVTRLVNAAEIIWLIGINGKEESISKESRAAFRLMYREMLERRRKLPRFEQINDTDALQALDIPAMLVVGEYDTRFGQEVAVYLARELPHAKLIRMRDVAHFPNLSKPQEVSHMLEQWLKDHTKR